MSNKKVFLLFSKKRFGRILEMYLNQYPDIECVLLSSQSYLGRLKNLFYEIILSKNRNFIFHADEPFANGFIAFLLSLLTRRPLIITLRGWGDILNTHKKHNKFKHLIISILSKIVLANADVVVAISKATINKLKNAGYTIDKFVIIHEPIDPKFSENVYNIRINKNKKVNRKIIFLTVTNLKYFEKFRGVLDIIETLRDLKSFNNFRFEYWVVGGGDYLEDLIKYCKYNKLDFVKIFGYRTDLIDIYSSADIFVYFSYLDSFGLVIPEAQSAGLPVVCNDFGGIPEACGSVGVIVRTREELKSVLLNMLHNIAILRRYSYLGLSRMSKYNLKNVYKYYKLYINL